MDILSCFPRELVRIIKQNSCSIDNVEALVDSNLIFIDDATLDIEEGDIVERTLPSGSIERFSVTDRGFMRGMNGIPDHYQLKVKKQHSFEFSSSRHIINQYNINGSDKVNINSIDNSSNYRLTSKELSTFEVLRSLAKDLDDRNTIISAINEMQESVGKSNFKDKYNAFIQSAANHMTLFAPFLPMLTKLLTK